MTFMVWGVMAWHDRLMDKTGARSLAEFVRRVRPGGRTSHWTKVQWTASALAHNLQCIVEQSTPIVVVDHNASAMLKVLGRSWCAAGFGASTVQRKRPDWWATSA